MMHQPRRFVFLLVTAALLAGCADSAPRTTPTTAEQARLDAHLAVIFADVAADDAAQLAADRTRAAHIQRIAYFAEQYRAVAGHYPFASPDSSVFRQTLIGDHVGDPSGLGETYVAQEALLAELRAVLGPEVTLPTDPLPDVHDGTRAYAYGVYGRGYITAAMLVHPVGWTEGILPRQWQYRIGASENLDLPILQMSKLLAGEYPETRAARPRDPGMALR